MNSRKHPDIYLFGRHLTPIYNTASQNMYGGIKLYKYLDSSEYYQCIENIYKK